MEKYILTTEEIEALLEKASERGATKALKAAIKPEAEKPMPRSKIMEQLGVKKLETFKKRAEEVKAVSVGKIDNEPAYYFSQFFKNVA